MVHDNSKPIFLELFCGTQTMTKTAKQNGFQAFSIDYDESLNPTLCADILDLTPEAIIEHCGGRPTVIWASPDCTQWSYARGNKNEFSKANKGKELSPAALAAIDLIDATLTLIRELEPKYWFLENPHHGALKEQKIMQQFPHIDIYYCAYDWPAQKHTRIWGDFPPQWRGRTTCSHTQHAEGVQSTQTNARKRAEIPVLLCEEICSSLILAAIVGNPKRPTLEDF